MAEVIVEFYKGRIVGRQKYRFRIKDAGNFKTLSVSNDAYVNYADAESAAISVTGFAERPPGQVLFVNKF